MKEIKIKLDSKEISKIILLSLIFIGAFITVKYICVPFIYIAIYLLDPIISMYPSLNINVQFGALILLVYLLIEVCSILIGLIIRTFSWYFDRNKKEEEKKTK